MLGPQKRAFSKVFYHANAVQKLSVIFYTSFHNFCFYKSAFAITVDCRPITCISAEGNNSDLKNPFRLCNNGFSQTFPDMPASCFFNQTDSKASDMRKGIF